MSRGRNYPSRDASHIVLMQPKQCSWKAHRLLFIIHSYRASILESRHLLVKVLYSKYHTAYTGKHHKTTQNSHSISIGTKRRVKLR